MVRLSRKPATFPIPSGRDEFSLIIPFSFNQMSGRQDLNLRPPAPKAGAMNRATLRPELLFQYFNEQSANS